MSRALLAVVAAMSLLLVVPPAEAASAIQIRKIYYDSPGTDYRTATSLNAEYIVLKNVSTTRRSLTGWTVRDAVGHVYTFGTFSLAAGAAVYLHTGSGTNSTYHRYWRSGNYIWNNDKDTAYLRNSSGATVDTCAYNSTAVDWLYC